MKYTKLFKLFKQLFLFIAITVSLMIVWVSFIFVGTTQGWWHEPLTKQKDPQVFMEAVKEKLQLNFVGNFAMAIIEDGEIYKEYFYSHGKPIDRNTAFQTASLSKWVSAWGVMKLVEEGRVELDAPVDSYLTRWSLPPSDFDNHEVTIRRLLSHTAGLTDELGYFGFPPGAPIQSLTESLTQARDTFPGLDVNGVTRVGIEPGSEFMYSGGGYTVLQLVIEEVSGMAFNSFMTKFIFEPLQMQHSTYIWSDSMGTDLADFYRSDTTLSPHHRYTALAASSLYSSLSDLERFMKAHLNGQYNEPVGRGVLSPETIEIMREPHASIGRKGFWKMDIWGLGTVLYRKNKQGNFIAGHDGGVIPRNFTVRYDPDEESGIIVMETGCAELANKIGSEWVYWKTGKSGFLLFAMVVNKMKSIVILGYVAILLLMLAIFLSRRRLLHSS